MPALPPSRRELLLGALGVGAASLLPGRGMRAQASSGGDLPGLEPVRYPLALAKDESVPGGRAILVNGSETAPEIRFRAGFLLRVEVRNDLDAATALHWHGLPVPNPMDGEVGVTQLPIEPGTVAVYEFPAARPGTWWYYSTVGFQRQLGLAGPLVVEEPSDPWDVARDAVLFLSDRVGEDPAALLAGLGRERPSPGADARERFVNPAPDGRPFATDVRFAAFLLNGRDHRNAWTCEAKPGARLRFRLVNGSAQTFFRFQVEGHALEVVAADGRSVEPVRVDHLVLGTGERYDVLVTVGGPGSFALRAAALGQPGGAVGVLHTPGVKPVIPAVRPRWEGRGLVYESLRARTPEALVPGPRRELRVAVSEEAGGARFAVDGRVFPSDPASGDLPPPLRVEPGDRVHLEIENRTRFFEAMHLHGHAFRLLLPDVDSEQAPAKDTVAIAPGGRVRLELVADNPGRWLLAGMGLYRRRAGLAALMSYVTGTG